MGVTSEEDLGFLRPGPLRCGLYSAAVLRTPGRHVRGLSDYPISPTGQRGAAGKFNPPSVIPVFISAAKRLGSVQNYLELGHIKV